MFRELEFLVNFKFYKDRKLGTPLALSESKK